jgi:DNA-binding GntR family transcriptional regulator
VIRLEDVDEIHAVRRRLEPLAVEPAVQAMTLEAMSIIRILRAARTLEGCRARSQEDDKHIMKRLADRDASGAAAAMDRHRGKAYAKLRKTTAPVKELRRDTSSPRQGKNDHG